MTVLENYFKNKSNSKLICVKLYNGTVDRVKESKAYQIVKDLSGEYCSKSVYDDYARVPENKQKIDAAKNIEVANEEANVKEHLKRKEIRANDKKKKKDRI